MQRQYNIGLNSNPGTISLAVDKSRFSGLGGRLGGGPRLPERAWPESNEFPRNRTNFKAPPPRYPPAYTPDVSHLIV